MCLDVSNGIHVLGTCRYVFGVTHVPRLEDWPVMPVEHVGFTLVVSAPFQPICVNYIVHTHYCSPQ